MQREATVQRREEILKDAVRQFAENGYRATTMDDLSRSLGMTKGNLYHYFQDKEEILFACHERCLDRLEDLLAESVGAHLPAGETLRRVAEVQLRALHGEFGGLALALELDALRPEHRARVVARRDAFERSLRAAIARGAARGELRAVDPRLAAFAVLGAVNWTARWFRPSGETSIAGLAAAFADLFLRGLEPRPEETSP